MKKPTDNQRKIQHTQTTHNKKTNQYIPYIIREPQKP